MKAFSPVLLLLGGLLLPFQHGFAADWQLVLSDRSRRVELDRASIFSSDPGIKVAWGRVVLSEVETLDEGYATIKALNRYDCQQRTFETVKRVYIDADENLVWEEQVEQAAALPVTPNSVDERMWREVCRPGTAREVKYLAGQIQQLVDGMSDGAALASPAPAGPAATGAENQHHEDRPQERPGAQAVRAQKVALDTAARSERAASAVNTPAARKTATGSVPEIGSRPTAQASDGAQPQAEAETGVGNVTKTNADDALEQLLSARASARQAAPPSPAWSYDGAHGPAAWGSLHPEWQLCAQGQRQAPIGLDGSLLVNLPPLKLHYHASGFRIRDRGHGLEVDVGDGMGMEVRGVRYELESFSLHRPSADVARGPVEHDMLAYFEHRSSDGQRALLVVPLRAAEEATNELLDTLLAHLPLERGEEYVPDAIIELGHFMPAQPGYFLYLGSLPRPPCSEGVLWVVLKTAAPMSSAQLALFSRLHAPNVRPPQPAHERIILESR